MGRTSDISKLTRAQIEKKLTPEQREFSAIVKRGKTDPVYFAKELLGIELHPGQKIWLWMTTRTQLDQAFALGVEFGIWKTRPEFDALLAKNPDSLKNVLVPSNRWGKTLVTSVKHIWYNYYKKGVRGDPKDIAQARCGTLNLSPHSNQCQAGYDYILDILSSRFVYVLDGKSFKNTCKIESFLVKTDPPKRKIIFSNNTSYRAVPTGEDQASSLAGTPYLYISYDECAQSLHLKAELPAKIMSRLIDYGGPLDLVSTPEVDKPSHQYFFHIAKLGLKCDEGWYTLIGKISDNIFLGSKERDKIMDSIRTTDPAKYRQVMFGEFVTTGKKMFDNMLIERLWLGFNPKQVLYEHKYLVWADWGFADTGDPTVFYVLDYTQPVIEQQVPKQDFPKYEVVYREAIRGGSPFSVLMRAKMLQREWNGAIFGHDSTAMGGVMIKKMLREMEMHDVIDFDASGGNKAEMLFSLIVVLSANRRTEVDEQNKVTDLNSDFGRLRSYYIPELEEQFGNYQYNPDKGVSDKKIEQDDVMCLGMAIWYLEKKVFKTNRAVGNISMNPLAPTVSQIFPEKSAQALHMKTITIPEKRIF